MTVQTKTVFETSDGSLFREKDAADDYEFDLQLKKANDIREELLRWKGAVPKYEDDMNIFSDRGAEATIVDVNISDFLHVLGWLVTNEGRYTDVKSLARSVSQLS